MIPAIVEFSFVLFWIEMQYKWKNRLFTISVYAYEVITNKFKYYYNLYAIYSSIIRLLYPISVYLNNYFILNATNMLYNLLTGNVYIISDVLMT